jgi:hypothetical protein
MLCEWEMRCIASGPEGEYGEGKDTGLLLLLGGSFENPAKEDAANDRRGPRAVVAGASGRLVARLEKGAKAEDDFDRLWVRSRSTSRPRNR